MNGPVIAARGPGKRDGRVPRRRRPVLKRRPELTGEETETGMDNSTLLGPAGHVFVNHARWDMSVPRFAAAQFGKPGFCSFALANLHANAVAAMPILYRLA